MTVKELLVSRRWQHIRAELQTDTLQNLYQIKSLYQITNKDKNNKIEVYEQEAYKSKSCWRFDMLVDK